MNEIKLKIQSNLNNYDLKQINELLINLDQEIELCVKINEDLLRFFNKKSNFRTIANLKGFSTNKLNYKIKSTKRVDIEEELAKISTTRNISGEKLRTLLGKPKIEAQQPVKKKAPKKPSSIKVNDQTSRWLSLIPTQLKDELNDLNRYPDARTLKQAAYSILKSNEKRFRIREKIINIILERISEEKAIANLGR